MPQQRHHHHQQPQHQQQQGTSGSTTTTTRRGSAGVGRHERFAHWRGFDVQMNTREGGGAGLQALRQGGGVFGALDKGIS